MMKYQIPFIVSVMLKQVCCLNKIDSYSIPDYMWYMLYARYPAYFIRQSEINIAYSDSGNSPRYKYILPAFFYRLPAFE